MCIRDSIGTDAYAMERSRWRLSKKRWSETTHANDAAHARQSASLIATGSMVHRTAYIERVMDPELSLPACQKVDNSAMWMLENLLDLTRTAEESTFFEDVSLTSQLMLLPHQRAQASLSTGAGGLGLSSSEARRMSASVGNMVATLPGVLADLSGIIGEKVRRELPDSDLVRCIWKSVRDLRDVHGVSE